MKLNIFNSGMVMILLMVIASPALATTPPKTNIETNNTRAQDLQNRLKEIEGLDTRALSRTQKKELRREVREIKKELAAISGGVYLSVGALILIALLLILLL